MRMLHTMLRVGDLDRSIAFYTNVLGMQVLRTTDRPDQKYTLAFVGYGDERSNAVLELTYNYGVDHYDPGTGYGRGRRCGGDVRIGARGKRALRRRRDARGWTGEGRHDGHRVRPGPGRLQDRTDRAVN